MGARAAAGKFQSHNSAEVISEAELPDVRCPVVDSVVLGGGGKFDVLGGEIDDAVIRPALVIAAGSGVVVEIGADPAGRLDQPL